MYCIHLGKLADERICTINKFGGKPTEANCMECKDYDGPSRGIGDTVKNVISKATAGKVKPCGGCQKRREALNKMMGYKKKEE